MKSPMRLLVLGAVALLNVGLLAANLSADPADSLRRCSEWRSCQCVEDGNPEGCCTVCATECNGCKISVG